MVRAPTVNGVGSGPSQSAERRDQAGFLKLERGSGDDVGGGVSTAAGITGIDSSIHVIQILIQYSHDDIEDRRRVDSSAI